MSLQQFGKRLAQLRREKAFLEERDIDRRDVAAAVGASPSSITRWEGGEVWPNEDTMTDLAKYFGVAKGWLRYGEGEKRPGAATPAATVTRGVRVAGEKAPKGIGRRAAGGS